jgi:IS5 family transposase
MQGSSRPDRELLDAAALCGHLLGEGSVHAFLAEHRHRLFPDELFADLFPTRRGRPSVPADQVATVMVLQALEGRSDREACRALQTDIAWKAAAGLALTEEAFHPTVLTLWRNKLRASAAPQRIFDAVRTVIVESGVIAGKHRRALDSTVLDDAVARQDTITMLVEQIRRVRRLIPDLAGVWVREHNLEGGRPPCDWDDPADRDRLVSELVDDANELVWAAENLELTDAQADAVALLALVAGQDVEPGDGPGQWRIAQRTAEDRIISTVDPEARHAHKSRHVYRDGYKAHVAAEPDTGLVTSCHIGPGNAGDADAAPDLLADEPAGTEVLGDSAYSSGELRSYLEGRRRRGGRGGGATRSSSAPKKLAAALRISFARRSSLFCRSSSFSRARSSEANPGRSPVSVSARRTHKRSVSRCRPSWPAMDSIAFHCDRYSSWCSNTIRTARSRTSTGYRRTRFCSDIAPSSQETEQSPIPGRFTQLGRPA